MKIMQVLPIGISTVLNVVQDSSTRVVTYFLVDGVVKLGTHAGNNK